MTMLRAYLALVATGVFFAGCSGGSPPAAGGGGGSTVSGIALPQEISALPTTAASVPGGLVAQLQAALSSDSDYASAKTFKYVDERALSQFDILNTIFKAIGQTHYADVANVNQGPYGTMVAWEEDHGDSQAKNIVPWVVDSSMIVENGQSVNQLLTWMLMPMGDGQTHLIKVKMKVYAPPTQNADGSYSDYGVWRLDAKFDIPGGYFTAEASRDANGLSVIGLHQMDQDGTETVGVLHKGDSSGYGKVSYPDWDSPTCHTGNGCTVPPTSVVAYVYDAASAALQKNGVTLYKDRLNVVDVVQRYGLFYAATGADVAKSHHFGFPFRYTDTQGDHYGYYGAWQGRHQVWGNGQSIPAGTTVTRDNYNGTAGESYTVSPVFTGVLVKRTLVPADILDLQDIIVGTWVNKSMSLTYNAAVPTWTACVNPNWSTYPPTCDPGSGPGFDISTLVNDPTINQNVNISACSSSSGPCNPVTLVYDPAAGALCYADNSQPPASTGQPWPLVDQAQAWVNINSPIFIYWDGTNSQWMKKKLVSFDQQTFTPVFDPDPTTETVYLLDLNRDYYFNDNGTNWVVTRTADAALGATAYVVKVERQSVANPGNAADFAPAGTVFKRMWGGDTQSTFVFDVADPGSPTFMKLVYQIVGNQDSAAGAVPGAPLASNEWSLVAQVNGVQAPEMYNWEYPNSNPKPGDTYGTQQFLIDANGYKYLDNPIRLAAIPLTNHASFIKKYTLQFDGSWVGGLPDIWNDLQNANWNMTSEIAAKVVYIPDGQIVTDADDGVTQYQFKPLQVEEYLLPPATTPALDLGPALALDLSVLAPTFADPGTGDMPNVPVKYVEGNPVQ